MRFPKVKLNDGSSIPPIAFGTGTALYGKECADLVLQALETGYTSLDSAQIYGNTASVGDALAKWTEKGHKREDVYILTKCESRSKSLESSRRCDLEDMLTAGGKSTTDDVNEARTVLEGLLKELKTDYVDMYLIHSPLVSKRAHSDDWKVMEQIKKDGLAKSIGVSNFREEDIAEMSKSWTVPPAVNQIEFNPYIWHAPNMVRLVKIMREHDIKMQTFGPLNSVHRVTGGPVDDIVQRIADKRKTTPAQVLLLWAAQYGGGTVVTTSRNEQRQKEQLEAFSQPPLTEDEIQNIAEAGKGKFHRNFMKEVWEKAKP